MKAQYKAKNVMVDGKPALMINENRNATIRATGETVHAAKIQFKILKGYAGDHQARAVYGYSTAQWVKMERVAQ